MGIFPRTKFLIYNIVIVIVKFYSNPFDKFYYYLWNDETKFKNNKISTSTIHLQIAKYLEESLFIKSYISFKYRLISFFPTVGKKSKIKKKGFSKSSKEMSNRDETKSRLRNSDKIEILRRENVKSHSMRLLRSGFAFESWNRAAMHLLKYSLRIPGTTVWFPPTERFSF